MVQLECQILNSNKKMKDRKISLREVEVGDYLNTAIEPYGFSLDRSECVEAMKQLYKAND